MLTLKSSDVFNACWAWLCSSDISIVAFPSSAFKCEIYNEPWFQKCPKLTMTQAAKEKRTIVTQNSHFKYLQKLITSRLRALLCEY